MFCFDMTPLLVIPLPLAGRGVTIVILFYNKEDQGIFKLQREVGSLVYLVLYDLVLIHTSLLYQTIIIL